MENNVKVSELLRTTIKNSQDFYIHVANHIENLENKLAQYVEKYGTMDELPESNQE